jgi:hypothetical protein
MPLRISRASTLHLLLHGPRPGHHPRHFCRLLLFDALAFIIILALNLPFHDLGKSAANDNSAPSLKIYKKKSIMNLPIVGCPIEQKGPGPE